MTGNKDKASPAKSDAAALPTHDEGDSSHDQPAPASTSNAIDDANIEAISKSLQDVTSIQDTATSHASPGTLAQADEGDKQAARSASVQAAEAAKRRENNFLEKLWK